MEIEITCEHCGKKKKKQLGHVNRAKKMGNKLFCSFKCFGLSRRTNKTEAQKKEEKKKYDIQYREKNEQRLKKKRAEWFAKDYAANPEKYKKERQRRMKSHIEYCSRPEYKKKKKVYDQHRRAKIQYGEYGEAAIALLQLAAIVDNRQAKSDQKIFNKSQKRKRNGKNSQRKELESSSVGIYQPS